MVFDLEGNSFKVIKENNVLMFQVSKSKLIEKIKDFSDNKIN